MQRNTLGVVHEFLRRSVQPGAFCIDATAGKGRDTALLCRLAGPEGRVLAFDIQPEAVEQTRQREKLEKQIVQLKAKMKKEKQLGRQMELRREIQELERGI